ncbi:MAG: ABC transporter ATP-binding protein [Bacteroidetes bacterium]|nr:MAG: ABC transporter ATP-binding protein [Bacteroidota bacterium]
MLEINQLHKEYGRITAVNELSLRVPRGSVFGLLGPNGSGKTTTLGMVLGVIRPTRGSFRWFGELPTPQQRKRVGAILEKPNFYPGFSARKNLELVAMIKEKGRDRIDAVLRQVGLYERQHDPFRTYSLGMKQRLAIGSALLADPEVLILDEPTNGLDPAGIADIRELIRDIAAMGKTIILASHLLDEVQKVCTDFAVLQQGHLIHTGPVAGQEQEVVFELDAPDQEGLLEVLPLVPGYLSHQQEDAYVSLTVASGTLPEQINAFLAERSLFLSHLSVHHRTLEQQFMEILSQHA